MEACPKILLLDDDPDLLDMYREILAQLPSKPDIRTASNGPRALALLEAEAFRLFICDLRMPKMDGLQVLSIVRRKHPQLRTVVLTSVVDEQFRSRVYALGVDLFWQKPGTDDEIQSFMHCLESLLGREDEAGFRGVQSKSLVDLIQLECISQNSVVLRITNGALAGRIWITGGELVDAETNGVLGEVAFARILGWKAGSFEALPAEPARPRTIFKSYNALLLETAQALDESRSAATASEISNPKSQVSEATAPPPLPALAHLAQLPGVEFVLALKPGADDQFESRGLENPAPKAKWTRHTLARFRALSDRVAAGSLEQIEGLGPQRHLALAPAGPDELVIGWQSKLGPSEVAENTRKAVASWVS
jgi:CheY-like chemotaxis protein